MTNGRPHVAIVATGGSFWLGGLQYTHNLVEALTRFPDDTGPVDVSVIVRDEYSRQSFQHLKSRLVNCLLPDELQERYTLANRIRWRAKRQFKHWVNPRLDEALLRMGATFAYPVSSQHIHSADWIADFQYAHHPDKMSAEEIKAREAQFSNTTRNAMHVVLSSAHAQADCHRIFPETTNRTSVLPFRVFASTGWLDGNPADTIAKYHLPERYLLVSNWMLPTKNHRLVLDALAALSPSQRSGIHVVCTGDIYDYRNPGYYNEFLSRVHTLGLAGHVFHLGVIPKIDQIQLLRGAQGYLQPSLFEGWNTGVEEAHLLGKSVLLSDIPVHREQHPAGAIYFDPNDAADLSQKLALFVESHAGPSWSREGEEHAVARYRAYQQGFARTFLDLGAGKPRARRPTGTRS